MLFKPSKIKLDLSQLINNLTISINGQKIEQVQSTKYLGVFIDENLTQQEHINHLIQKISCLTGMLYRVKSYLPFRTRKDIYFALAYSKLIYCIEIYAKVGKTELKPLIVRCNRLLRLLQNKPRKTHVKDLYIAYATLYVDKLFLYITLKRLHKCIYLF